MKNNKQSTIIEIACFTLPTQDDWSPNLIRNTVRIRANSRECTAEGYIGFTMFQISVWGGDDTGMEMFFFGATKDKELIAAELLKELDRFPNPLNKDWLRRAGFQRA